VALEKLPTSHSSRLDPSTNSVPLDIMKTAIEAQLKGEAANQEFQAQLSAQFDRQVPGNSPYSPTDTNGF
jgi:hypothetical protein